MHTSRVTTFRRTKSYQKALAADLFIESQEPHGYALQDTRRESDEIILARIQQARSRPELPVGGLSEPCLRLQQAYLFQVGHPERMPLILAVARTIARLDLYYDPAEGLRPQHLAEAMQYAPKQAD